ncbi:hypothetical protein [Nitrosomonas sp. H1_AOB3]|uniref:PIN domain-containing protein n=1 Tax=Nitrosomonas sp. H1_AOB3 TaxID=2741553 RepID=UPI00257A0C29|nr:hypothetical protein [Nitrosomonas sp. H1_AOB3]
MFLADVVEPQGSQDSNLRDSGDQPVLLTLITAQTDYLVTDDKDLLALARDYPIVTPAEFWSRHGE